MFLKLKCVRFILLSLLLFWRNETLIGHTTGTCHEIKRISKSEGSPCGSVVKNPPAKQEVQVGSLGQEDPLEEVMATHSSVLAWRIPWTEEPRGLWVHGVAKSQTWLKRLSTHSQHFRNKRHFLI